MVPFPLCNQRGQLTISFSRLLFCLKQELAEGEKCLSLSPQLPEGESHASLYREGDAGRVKPLPPFSEVSISVNNEAIYKITQEEWHGARLVVSLTFVRPHSEQKATQPTNNPLFE